ncbi:hypothetical protein J2W46_001869 [Paraburkholderia strydomiana]|nr:hypothetical protein [Paraburkholderia strydomiana]
MSNGSSGSDSDVVREDVLSRGSMRSGTRSDLRTDSRSRSVAQHVRLRSARGSYGSDLVIPVEHKCHHQFRTVCTIFSRAIKESTREKSCFRFALLRSYNTLFNRLCALPRMKQVERVSSRCFASSKSNALKRRFAALSICIAECVCCVLHFSASCRSVSASEMKFNAMRGDACGRLRCSLHRSKRWVARSDVVSRAS